MELLKIVLAGFIFTALLFYVIWYFSYYRDCKSYCVGKIKFRQFLLFYAVNASPWSLHDGYVNYCLTKNVEDYDMRRDYSLYFSQIDTIRYQRWKKRREKGFDDRMNANCFAVVLKSIQIDIDNYQKENAKVVVKHEETEGTLEKVEGMAKVVPIREAEPMADLSWSEVR